ncbi:MAG TPA: SusC/RagA family TonB-linked outer membrane protein [Niabella sp.]|uniref:SusC/RagA family TonB-linked outer membrane protein n=1 Tax=Agriterribacter sp. TaxID=2821509 RepID=UPI002C5DCDD2|nr:SusC/RagA family TonB-linked outer membrane protein [Agriterribacter sp.]HRO85870.1 SusC/RagA family TonB-linked outer membrane protein [Niabella sp.]HRP56247.1 SusC/RagA family TonB-linked outer membrane protein [Agriterribacter sp.]
MNFVTILLLACCLQISAHVSSQGITLNVRNAPLERVFREIRKQTGYTFMYTETILKEARKVSVHVKNSSLQEALAICFSTQPFTYKIIDKTIVLQPLEPAAAGIASVSTKTLLLPPIEIHGRVVNERGEPLQNVSVLVTATKIGVATNANGRFTLTAPDDKNIVLEISSVGFKTKTVTVGKETEINVILELDVSGLNDIVVVGYGSQKKIELTNAVSSIKSDDFVNGAINDAAQLIKGQVAGLTVINPDANPLSVSQIVLRGISTLASGTQPLVVIDGIPGSLTDVAPDDIQSISVLKDGSAAAIYGTRGTNGVILITTKKNNGKVAATVELHSYVSTQRITKTLDFMDADEYRKLAQAGKNGAIDYGSNTNWLDEIFRKPISQTHNISIKGGNANTNYLMNINYKALDGLVQKSDNDVLNYHIRANHSMLNGKLKIYGSLMGFDQKYFNGIRGDIYRHALIYNPTDPVKDANGNWTEHVSTYTPNPMGLIKETKSENKITNFKPSVTITIRPFNNLSVAVLASKEISNGIAGYAESFNHFNSLNLKRTGYASRDSYRDMNDFMEITSNYVNTFRDHSLTVLVGYSFQQNAYEEFSMNNYDFPSELYSYNNMALGKALSEGRAGMGSYKEKSKLIGYFGRLNYNLSNKYFLNTSLRYEGSSKFGENNKWGLFPSVSVGWNISKESFMEDITLLSLLKLRAGFGVTGTVPSASYTSLSRLSYGGKYFYNGQWISVIQPSSNANPDLRWETKEEINIGVDFGFLKDRITGAIDIYKRNTKDLLWEYKVPMPPYLFPSVLANAGSMENKGIEIQINANIIKGPNFEWNTNLNFSTNKNKVISLSNKDFKLEGGFFYTGSTGEPIQSTTHIVREGEALGNFWGYKSVGIDDNGYWIIEDKDGKSKSIYDQQPDDKKILGNGLPKNYLNWNNTVNYKYFDLTVTMRGAFGYQILNTPEMFYSVPVSLARGNIMKNSYDNVYGKRPLNDLQELQYLSYYIENGDFWKIDNITLGFTHNFLKGPMKSCRIYASGSNLFTITGYSGIDPEVNSLGLSPGMDNRDRYPSTRTYTLGASFKF